MLAGIRAAKIDGKFQPPTFKCMNVVDGLFAESFVFAEGIVVRARNAGTICFQRGR